MKISLIYDDETDMFILTNNLEFRGQYVPKGTKTDGASVPVCLRWIAPRLKKALIPSIFHDEVYRLKTGRKSADLLFYRMLRHNGMGKVQAKLMYIGVRLAGWYSYNFK